MSDIGAKKTGKVLVVDDEFVNRELLEDLLMPMGHEVSQAANGEIALEQVANDPPDVILLDVMMPGIDGFEVAKRLKMDARTKGIPIVMVTALNSADDRIKALEAGANDFLSKPFDRLELQATVRSQMQVKAYYDFMKDYQTKLETEVARRTSQLRQVLTKLRQASLDTIMRLARAAEYKDEDTGAHILRMSSYAAAVCRQMGLGEEVAQRVLYAAPMHDVGKIGIPDHILLKPGKLDPDEWEIMKTHTTIGGNILSGARDGYVKLAEVIALTHHERWDGTGYPLGLKGAEIPLAGQISAISDVFDALSPRSAPIKKPFRWKNPLPSSGRARVPISIPGYWMPFLPSKSRSWPSRKNMWTMMSALRFALEKTLQTRADKMRLPLRDRP